MEVRDECDPVQSRCPFRSICQPSLPGHSQSNALVEAIGAGDKQIYRRCARKWLANDLPPVLAAYIRDRIQRYDKIALGSGRPQGSQAYGTALEIWNLGLFFETHEYLETIWLHSSGDEHQARKGLINSAGVYIHLENQNRRAARRLARRAWQQIRDNSHCLKFLANLDVLLSSLHRLEEEPPRLEFAAHSDTILGDR